MLHFVAENLGVFWASAAALPLACGTSAMRYTVSESLVLEQVPDLRGTVMPLNPIALGLGATAGSSLGGLTLISLGFGGLGAFGLLSLTASLLYSVFAVDPVTP
jgi:predicted MFS family arabinose efflux permease